MREKRGTVMRHKRNTNNQKPTVVRMAEEGNSVAVADFMQTDLPGKRSPAAMRGKLLRAPFEQVWVVNLKRRPDRLEQFWNELNGAKWPFAKPEVFFAIDGDKVGVPKFWQTGGGSYGCMRSHLTLLERAIQDDVGSILVLEDDAVFSKNFAKDVARFLRKVPGDWECLMLGGQHVNSEPIPIAPGIVRAGCGGGIQRTHCYALRGQEPMKALYRTWANAAVHCDWVMGPCMAKFNTYAPDPFLIGQAEGHSDISGRRNPAKFWRPPTGLEPVIVLDAPRPVMEALQAKGWHGGYTRDPQTGIDMGLTEIFSGNLTSAELGARLKGWINMIQWEVVSMTGEAHCTIWHPAVRLELVRPLVSGKVVKVTANSVEDALKQLPTDIDVLEKENIRVVLLRSSRSVMEELRNLGWHSGNWRDEVTGQDNGVRKLFAASRDKLGRRAGLQRIIQVLHDEARNIPHGIVTLWHDEITKDMVQSEYVTTCEITATTAAAAVDALKEFNKRYEAQG
jgi:hypothetical protein